MKKYLIPIVIVGALLLWVMSAYNGFVSLDEDSSNSWANVQSAYQERNDLVGNLVSTVQGAADFEKKTLTEVIEARAKASSINIDANNITPDAIAKFQQAQSGLTGALSKLMVVVERYPELKANQNFLELQSQLEGIENRIRVERIRYNESVTIYNKAVRKAPKNIIAGMFGFDRKEKFAADEEAQKSKKVEFNF